MRTTTCATPLAAFVAAACTGTASTLPAELTPPRTWDATAQCNHNPGYQRADSCCILPAYVSSLDVDTAFSRVMQTYRFPTKADAKGRSSDRIYRYQSVKGQYHSAANEVAPSGERTLAPGLWLFVTLERETDATSSVSAAYCALPGRRPDNPAAWHAAVQQSIRATVPPK
jgi:hypothetical protein